MPKEKARKSKSERFEGEAGRDGGRGDEEKEWVVGWSRLGVQV